MNLDKFQGIGKSSRGLERVAPEPTSNLVGKSPNWIFHFTSTRTPANERREFVNWKISLVILSGLQETWNSSTPINLV